MNMTGDKTKHLCTSKAILETLTLTWTIENASFVLSPKRQVFITSDHFSSRNGKHKWNMVVSNHYRRLNSYGVYLIVLTNDESVKAAFSISILDSTGEKLNVKKFPSCEIPDNREVGFDNYFDLHELLQNQEQCSNDTLTLFCEVKTLVDSFNISGNRQVTRAAPFSMPLNNLGERFGSMLQSESFTDVVIIVQNREIKAHKFMLASQSIVFEAMLQSDMKEKQQSRIIISDIEYEVIQQMLLYMYTRDVPKLKSMADRLLVAADKYALDDLKVVCEQALCEALTTNRAIEMLALAELYNTSLLKKHATSYLGGNIDEVMKTTEWKKMILKHSLRTHS